MKRIKNFHIFALLLALCSFPASIMSQETLRNHLFIAVLGHDGIIFPVAEYTDKQWKKPWTEPFEKRETQPLPQLTMPHKWYYYQNTTTIVEVEKEDALLIDTYCLQNWGYNTNWKEKTHRKPHYARKIVGIVFNSNHLEIIPEESLEDYSIQIQDILTSLELIDTDVSRDSHGHVHYEYLGYFRIDKTIYGFIREVGYESEGYLIYELSKGKGEEKLIVFGGGC